MTSAKLGALGKEFSGNAIAELGGSKEPLAKKDYVSDLYSWNGVTQVPSWRFAAFLDPFMDNVEKALMQLSDPFGGSLSGGDDDDF